MKNFIILAILVTLGVIAYKFKKDKNLKKFFITLVTFATIITLAIVGNLTRPVMPLFIAHEILILISWGALFMYIFKEKYYWCWFVSPLVTIGLFFLLEFIGGASHELT